MKDEGRRVDELGLLKDVAVKGSGLIFLLQ